MANVFISEVLYFIVNIFGSTMKLKLKSILVGFHTEEELIEANVWPEDSVSQVGSVKSVASTKAKAVMLSAKAKALKALQEIELQELRCKQERERIELELQKSEAEVEIDQVPAGSSCVRSVSQVTDGSVQFVNKSK